MTKAKDLCKLTLSAIIVPSNIQPSNQYCIRLMLDSVYMSPLKLVKHNTLFADVIISKKFPQQVELGCTSFDLLYLISVRICKIDHPEMPPWIPPEIVLRFHLGILVKYAGISLILVVHWGHYGLDRHAERALHQHFNLS